MEDERPGEPEVVAANNLQISAMPGAATAPPPPPRRSSTSVLQPPSATDNNPAESTSEACAMTENGLRNPDYNTIRSPSVVSPPPRPPRGAKSIVDENQRTNEMDLGSRDEVVDMPDQRTNEIDPSSRDEVVDMPDQRTNEIDHSSRDEVVDMPDQRTNEIDPGSRDEVVDMPDEIPSKNNVDDGGNVVEKITLHGGPVQEQQGMLASPPSSAAEVGGIDKDSASQEVNVADDEARSHGSNGGDNDCLKDGDARRGEGGQQQDLMLDANPPHPAANSSGTTTGREETLVQDENGMDNDETSTRLYDMAAENREQGQQPHEEQQEEELEESMSTGSDLENVNDEVVFPLAEPYEAVLSPMTVAKQSLGEITGEVNGVLMNEGMPDVESVSDRQDDEAGQPDVEVDIDYEPAVTTKLEKQIGISSSTDRGPTKHDTVEEQMDNLPVQAAAISSNGEDSASRHDEVDDYDSDVIVVDVVECPTGESGKKSRYGSANELGDELNMSDDADTDSGEDGDIPPTRLPQSTAMAGGPWRVPQRSSSGLSSHSTSPNDSAESSSFGTENSQPSTGKNSRTEKKRFGCKMHCPLCGRICASPRGLSIHSRFCEGPITCEGCQRVFKTKHALAQHYKGSSKCTKPGDQTAFNAKDTDKTRLMRPTKAHMAKRRKTIKRHETDGAATSKQPGRRAEDKRGPSGVWEEDEDDDDDDEGGDRSDDVDTGSVSSAQESDGELGSGEEGHNEVSLDVNEDQGDASEEEALEQDVNASGQDNYEDDEDEDDEQDSQDDGNVKVDNREQEREISMPSSARMEGKTSGPLPHQQVKCMNTGCNRYFRNIKGMKLHMSKYCKLTMSGGGQSKTFQEKKSVHKSDLLAPPAGVLRSRPHLEKTLGLDGSSWDDVVGGDNIESQSDDNIESQSDDNIESQSDDEGLGDAADRLGAERETGAHSKNGKNNVASRPSTARTRRSTPPKALEATVADQSYVELEELREEAASLAKVNIALENRVQDLERSTKLAQDEMDALGKHSQSLAEKNESLMEERRVQDLLTDKLKDDLEKEKLRCKQLETQLDKLVDTNALLTRLVGQHSSSFGSPSN